MASRQVTLTRGKVDYTVEVPANPRQPQSMVRVVRRRAGCVPMVMGEVTMEMARVLADVVDSLDGVRHRHLEG